MIEVLGDLLGVGGHSSARQIFTSINSHHARVQVMTSLLEYSLINKDKGPEYDQILADFDKISDRRNDYVHNIWWTHSSGRVFLARPGSTNFSIHDGREVHLSEIDGVLTQIGELMGRVREKQADRLKRHRQGLASQDTDP